MEDNPWREHTVFQEVIAPGLALPAFMIVLILGGDMNSVIAWGVVLNSHTKVLLHQPYSPRNLR